MYAITFCYVIILMVNYMIDLELYKIFYYVALCGNITKASVKLNISQPAVTKHIKNLESSLGVILFVRTRKGVVLTPIGKKIFMNIKNSLAIIKNVEDDVIQFKTNNCGTIRIGVSTSLVKLYLIDFINVFHNKYPNVSFDISTDTTKKNIEALENGLLDIVISKKPHLLDKDLSYKKILESSYEFVVNKQYYDKITQPIKLSDIVKYPLLFQKKDNSTYKSLMNFLSDNKLYTSSNINIGSSSLLLDFVKIGYGIGYTTKLYAFKYLEDKELFVVKTIPKTPKVEFGIITLKNNIITNICLEFINIIEKSSDIIEN